MIFGLGDTPLQTGISLLPLIPTLFIGSLLSPRMAERIGTRIPVTVGLLIAAGGIVLLFLPACAKEDTQDNLTQQEIPVAREIQEKHHDATL